MKRIISVILLICITLLLAVNASAAEKELHWYCIRTKANKQPPTPCEFSFIEELDGYCIDRAHGDGNEDRVVYLTFDAGYENGNVGRILDVLKAEDVRAAFFVLSHLIRANPELLDRMTSDGHLVCNHTATHKNLSNAPKECIKKEITALEETYREVTGKELARYFRPPEGSFSREMLKAVKELGYKTIFWSFAYADWDNNKQPSPTHALRTVMDNVHNGAVMLLHPTSATNVTILPQVIRELKSLGYRFGTLDELCKS